MHSQWIIITDNLKNGIKIVNKLGDAYFPDFLEFLFMNLNGVISESDIDHHLNESKLELREFRTAVKSLNFVLKRSLTFIVKPTNLNEDLRKGLGLSEVKAEILMKLWNRETKRLVETLDPEDDVQTVHGRLKVQLSSQGAQKEKSCIADTQLKMTSGKRINLEMDHSEIVSLYNVLETIQIEIDNLRGS